MLNLNKRLSELAKIVDGRLIGNGDTPISGLSGIKEAEEGDLTFLANSKYLPQAKDTRASAILVSDDVELSGKPLIVVENPSYAFAQIINEVLDLKKFCSEGIHPTAVIADDVKLGENVAVGPHVVIESEAVIGDSTVIQAGTFIGHEAQIGKNCLIYPNVTIRERCLLGDRVIIHCGSVIGSDGFGFEMVDGVHAKIPQIGIVDIKDDVEIGANVTIDRARFNKTVIGKGSKVDNLVQIAHNVRIGEHCIIVAQAGISGSVDIESKVILAGQSGIAGHLTIGEGAVVAAQAGVTKSVPAQAKVSGYPAMPHNEARKLHVHLKRLPEYIKTVQELKKLMEDQKKA